MCSLSQAWWKATKLKRVSPELKISLPLDPKKNSTDSSHQVRTVLSMLFGSEEKRWTSISWKEFGYPFVIVVGGVYPQIAGSLREQKRSPWNYFWIKTAPKQEVSMNTKARKLHGIKKSVVSIVRFQLKLYI